MTNPDTTALPNRDNIAPISFEADASNLTIEGELPRELNGTLYRNGPNPQFPSPGAHWFVGDGMLHAFHVENGKASYRNRWVRTPKFMAEHDAGRALYGSFGQLRPDAPSGTPTNGGVANTNIVHHAGKLYALEEAHLPTEIDPKSLETLGIRDFGGSIAGPFTAHPKTDPVTGEMLFFGYNAAGPFSPKVSYGVLDREGRVASFQRFEAPFASMVHDFVVTEKHVLFPILPLTGSMQRAMSGKPPYAWEPDKGSAVGVMKRGGSTDDIVWFRGEACYVFHVMNAWEEGEKIIADVMQFEEPPLFPHPDGKPTDPQKSRARLCRWTFDMAGNTDRFTTRYLDDVAGEFPRVDDRHAGFATHHGWFASAAKLTGAGIGFGGISHVDMAKNKTVRFNFAAGDQVSEPVFVERAKDAKEGDGWLLSTVYRTSENRSDLAVFNATDIEAGPIALVKLDHRVPAGFHGNWVNAG